MAYTRDHGKAHMKNLYPSWRKLYKRMKSKVSRQVDKRVTKNFLAE